MNQPFDLVILGAGAAGLMSAIAAAETAEAVGRRLSIALVEKNRQAGIKLLVCGGGRCNFTNAGTVDFLIAQFGRNGRFLTPALRHLDNAGLRAFFERLGQPSHEEHDGKIYPDSNSAREIVDALVRRVRGLGVEIFAGEAVTEVERTISEAGGTPALRVRTAAREMAARAMILATGGMSYQRMGTTGDGYRFAEALGHTVVTPRPAIVGLLVKEEWVKGISGTPVQDVEVKIEVSGPLPRLATGKPTPSVNDMLFTHFGLSGPAVLNVSEIVAELLEKFETVPLRIDFARHFSHDALAGLFRGWQQNAGKKLVRTMLSQHAPDVTIESTSPDQTFMTRHAAAGESLAIPARLGELLLGFANISATQTCSQLTAGQIHALVQLLKSTRLTVTATRGFKEAMVTAGGIALTEVDPKTLASKVTPGLFVTGEVLDLTGPSGGYNLQLAFSTGHLAGVSAARALCG